MKTPESVLKKQATQAKIAGERAAAEKAAQAKAKTDIEKFKANAAKYDEEYKKAEQEAIVNRRKAKAEGGFYVPAEPKLALVIRIRGTIGVSPKAKKVMQVRRFVGTLSNFLALFTTPFPCGSELRVSVN